MVECLLFLKVSYEIDSHIKVFLEILSFKEAEFDPSTIILKKIYFIGLLRLI